MCCFAVLFDECLLVAYINNTISFQFLSFSAHPHVDGCFAVHKTILELRSQTASRQYEVDGGNKTKKKTFIKCFHTAHPV